MYTTLSSIQLSDSLEIKNRSSVYCETILIIAREIFFPKIKIIFLIDHCLPQICLPVDKYELVAYKHAQVSIVCAVYMWSWGKNP